MNSWPDNCMFMFISRGVIMLKVTQKELNKAFQALARKDFIRATKSYEKLYSIDKKHHQILGNLAYCYDAIGRYEDFFNISIEALTYYPKDLSLIQKAAVAEHKLGRHRAAYDRLLNCIETHGLTYETAMNMCTVVGELGMNKEGLKYAIEAVNLRPDSAAAHNNLGAVFLTMNRQNDAIICFETALLLDKKNVNAYVNIGVIYNKQGVHEKAIHNFLLALNYVSPTDSFEINRIKFFLGLSQLAVGQLKEGWENYEAGWLLKTGNARNPQRTFEKDRWTGQVLGKKRLLVWREQGLGDEIFFMSAIPYLLKSEPNVDLIVECDPRLIEVVQRSFPTATVRSQQYYATVPYKPLRDDYDFQIPVGSLFAHYHQDIGSFKDSAPYLKVSKESKTLFNDRLGDRNSSLRVGICWRSGLIDASRNHHYSALSDWGSVFKVPNIQFVNLQYGDTRNEVSNAEVEFGVSLNSWSDIDRKNDLDNLSALISTLDLVISVGTAVAQISAAVGVPVWFLHVTQDWPQFGQSSYPAYPNVQMLRAPLGGGVVDLLHSLVPKQLAELQQKNVAWSQATNAV